MPSLDDIQIKINRAKKHIDDLHRIIDTSIVRNYAIRIENDPNGKERVYYVSKLPEIPPDIGLIAGDVLHNVRSTLDHIAYALVFNDTGGNGVPSRNPANPFKHVQFPIFDSAQEYFAPRGRGRQIEGMKQRSIDAIDATKPYKGGTDELWLLHKLDIIDKHRTLLTVSGSIPMVIKIPRHDYSGSGATVAYPARSFKALPTNPIYPLFWSLPNRSLNLKDCSSR